MSEAQLESGCGMDSSVKHHKASEYWKKVPATLEGVLGGYPELTKVDLRSSKNFLENLLKKFNITDCYDRALDCGAGIGRVTQGLLVQLYNKVDLVEMCQKFLDEVPKYVNSAEKVINFRVSLLHFIFIFASSLSKL
jgi:protein N-terminal methyltransferase